MTKLALVCALSLAVGTGAGFFWGRGISAEAALPDTSQPQGQPVIDARETKSGDSDRMQLRAMLHDELHDAIKSELAAALSHAPGQLASTPTPQAPPSSADLMQQREAMQAIDTVVAQAQFGEEDRSEFYQKLSVLNPQEAEQAMSKLTMAINSGRMKWRAETVTEE